jgi:hypothetical protein
MLDRLQQVGPVLERKRAERCHEVYREKASGKATKGRPQLGEAIDALVVARHSRPQVHPLAFFQHGSKTFRVRHSVSQRRFLSP